MVGKKPLAEKDNGFCVVFCLFWFGQMKNDSTKPEYLFSKRKYKQEKKCI